MSDTHGLSVMLGFKMNMWDMANGLGPFCLTLALVATLKQHLFRMGTFCLKIGTKHPDN